MILVEARDEDRARRYFEAQRFDVAERDGEVQVLTDPEEGAFSDLRRELRELEVQISVTAPRSMDIRLRTSDGDIQIGDIDGDVMLATSDGDLATGDLNGTMFDARTSDGDIYVPSAEFKNIVVRSSDGDIALGAVTAEETTARTSDGDIYIEGLAGISDIQTSDGDISVGSLVSSSSQIRTSDGDISIGSAEGDLTARSSDGDIAAVLVQPGTVALRTSDGDISLEIPEKLAASLDFTASEIQMTDCCESFEGTREEGRAKGEINGGGSRLQAHASDGTVRVRAY